VILSTYRNGRQRLNNSNTKEAAGSERKGEAHIQGCDGTAGCGGAGCFVLYVPWVSVPAHVYRVRDGAGEASFYQKRGAFRVKGVKQ
jgi:hypothetical protein